MLAGTGNNLFAYISRATVLLYSIEEAVVGGQKQAHIKSQECSFDSVLRGIREMSIEYFKTSLFQQQSSNNEESVKISIVWLHEDHQDWLKGLYGQKVKLFLVNGSQRSGNTFNFEKNLSDFFNFKEKPTMMDIQQECDITQRSNLEQLPESFLLVELFNQIQIFKVEQGVKTVIYRSNLGQSFHYALLEEVLAREEPSLLLRTINQAIGKVLLEGNSGNSDLLVEDIFGKEGCSFIGLPPRLIASSLGKFATDKEGRSNNWDRLKSVLTAFAINLAKQINHQVFATKISKTLFITHEFSHPRFLQLIQAIVSRFGEIWFYPHGMAANFVERLKSAEISQKSLASHA